MARLHDSCSVYSPQDFRYFHFAVSRSATKHLAAGESISRSGPCGLPGYTWTVRCWPRWVVGGGTPDMVKLSLLVTHETDPESPRDLKVVTTNMELLTRTGVPPRTVTREAQIPFDGRIGGVSLLVPREEVDGDCVINDHLVIALCTVGILDWPPVALPPLPSVRKDPADVSFRVEGDTIQAHRLVLAARSPVFKAELFGEMVEGRDQSRIIDIQDMTAHTFNLMLDFIYKNALPPAAPIGDVSAMFQLQHLLIAADRYGLDTLRQTCEDTLCTGITKETVVPTLEFAEGHLGLDKLKSRCLDFLDVPENFKEVGATDEFLHLMSNRSLRAELQTRFKRKRARLV